MIALADRFGYQRTLPTMSWHNVVAMTDAAAPGLLQETLDGYAGRRPVDLREEALSLVLSS